MALRSRAFAGNTELEAAAVSDAAHILRGARGDHVVKIQQALNLIDNAGIEADGAYGPGTAAAVLAYKRKRNIINPAYQTQADDIVGKMTVASLDADMLSRQSEPVSGPASLQPIFPRRSLGAPGFATLVPQSVEPSKFTASPAAFTAGPSALAPRAQFDTVALDIQVFGVGSFRVVDGVGGTVNIDPSVAVLFDPKQLTAPDSIPVTEKSQVFNVRGIKGGLTLITFFRPFGSLLDTPQPIVVIVRDVAKKPRKVPVEGTQHNHLATGRWPEIRQNPKNGLLDEIEGGGFVPLVTTPVCIGCATPKCAIDAIVALKFDQLPVARGHIDWYLRSGGGRDFDEDGNISSWIRLDHGIRKKLVTELRKIPVAQRRGQKTGFFEFSRSEYEDTDFHFSFGSIDRVDFEFDFDLKECTIWFKDRYEWHPVYDGIYVKMAGDIARSTNCIHAAMVEMKSEGARDFWMTGQATVAMEKLFLPAP